MTSAKHFARFHRVHRAACLLLIAIGAGCSGGEAGPERGSLQGNIKLDGQPLTTGSLVLVPTGGTQGPSSGAVIKDGTYSISSDKGPVLGTYRVEIKSTQATGKKIEAGSPMPPGTMVDVMEQLIPPEYNKDSTLTVEIKSGENSKDFALKRRRSEKGVRFRVGPPIQVRKGWRGRTALAEAPGVVAVFSVVVRGLLLRSAPRHPTP